MLSAVIQHLARQLSASDTQSGQAIADQLGCSRAAVWKHIQTLRSLGIEVDAFAGQGYRLRESLELLEPALIRAQMQQTAQQKLTDLRVEMAVDSTSSTLQRMPISDQHGVAILAEQQVAGRGRRGRQWHSPFARNLYLSLGWKFEQSIAELGCLSLVLAISAARALSRVGLVGHRIKWPNDLLLDGRKLCGCLAEVQGDTQGPCHAVLGVGVNVQMPAPAANACIDQPWTDLQQALPGCSRNELAARLLEELTSQLTLFANEGFAPFAEQWEHLDGLRGKTIDIVVGNQTLHGTVAGIDSQGALMLITDQGTKHLHSGEVGRDCAVH